MTALDILVLILVGGGLVLGGIRGFVCEILSLFAWVAAILALSYFHDPATQALHGPIGTWAGASMAAFALVFGLVFLAGKLLSRYFGRRVRTSVVGPIDRLLGAGFGALKGLIGATLLYLAANLVHDTLWGRTAERPEWMAQSRTYPLLHASGVAIVDLVEARRGPERIEQDDPGAGTNE
ncbi:MAG: CvpA family protein [Allosphingosinicella sp.]|uniref:CvpA family protein n=1 Tax=Allosphingosinicella sp. TaxID=2823234 RepID=UPI0039283101